MTIVACVRTGTAFEFGYVVKMRNMVARHMHRPYTMFCLTDQPERCDGVTFLDVEEIGLKGWWAKVILFAPEWRGLHKVVYCDLDSVIINDITPLADAPGEFSIMESPVRRAGIDYPCKYNSSVMVIGGGQCSFVWSHFDARRDWMMERCGRYGDQRAIELLYPEALFLEPLMPRDFFCNYRHLTMHPPKHSAVINFGGSHKPHTCPIPWVQEAWQ
jgi:hypothetical protein